MLSCTPLVIEMAWIRCRTDSTIPMISLNRFTPATDLRYRAVPAPEDAAARDGNKCLVRTVETGFQQPAGHEIPFKIEVSGTISPVGDLDGAQRVQCELDAVASHGKKDCTVRLRLPVPLQSGQ